MRTNTMILTTLACLPMALLAQKRDNQERTLACDDSHWGSDRLVRHCEMREQTMPASSLDIDAGVNCGVSVKGWSGSHILVRAKVEAAAPTKDGALELSGKVRLSNGSRVHADGPENVHDKWWAVNYEIFGPWKTDVSAKAHNGGVHIQDVRGRIRFEAVNGGVTLARLAGDVQGETTNGGLNIDLAGERWDGQGMDVSTTNGGVRLNVPEGYSAHVETATVNGGMHVDFPVTVSGHIGKSLSFDVGKGGAKIRAVTTNGGVRINKS